MFSSDSGNRIAIIDGLRSVMGKSGKSLSSMQVDELGAHILKSLRYKVSSLGLTHSPAEVIIGNVAQPPHASNVAKVISSYAGIPNSVPAFTVNRNCASGMEAITTAATRITALHHQTPNHQSPNSLYYAGGAESMSNIPLLFSNELKSLLEVFSKKRNWKEKISSTLALKISHLSPKIGLLLGLTDPTCNLLMGKTAENIARQFSISRKEQDTLSLRSHNLAELATVNEIFQNEITPISGESLPDEGIRNGQTLAKLSKLKPLFDRNHGTVTAGNSSQITDGACMLALMHEKDLQKYDIKPLCFIKGFCYAGCDPKTMGLGPVFSTSPLLKKLGMTLQDIDLIELNEAFASQVLGCLEAFASEEFYKNYLPDLSPLGLPDISKVNPNGGAIALGHPVGMTGSRLILHAAKEINRRNLSTALITLCIGGGQGGSIVIERE